jgi:two-component system, chemotaxis family, chemotaxis protein CheY
MAAVVLMASGPIVQPAIGNAGIYSYDRSWQALIWRFIRIIPMLKAVIIDGSAISRNLLSSVLTGGGHEVIGDSNTSAAGIARMIKLRPQIVCIDIGQADENSMQMLDTLRNSLPKAILFMVSGAISPAAVQQALQHGVHGFIVTPFNSVTVLKTIRNTILTLTRAQQKKVVE